MRLLPPLSAALVLSLASATLASAPARAALMFAAELTNAQEVAPVLLTTALGAPRPASFGAATLSLNEARTALTLSITVRNIDLTGSQTPDPFDDLVAAHIHAAAMPGSNAPVVWGFFGAPDNDISPKDLVVAPFAGGVGGTITSVWNQPEGQAGTNLTAQLPNLLAGLAYLNLHTVQNPAGEIRGQILPVAVPEPASLALLGAGVLGLGLARRARRRPGGSPEEAPGA